MIEIVDALTSAPGMQFTVDDLLMRFGSTPRNIIKMAERAAEGALIRKGRDVAGGAVYWAQTSEERDRYRRFGADSGDLIHYDAYLHSHWDLAEAVQWVRR
jgi:hypothetical protein